MPEHTPVTDEAVRVAQASDDKWAEAPVLRGFQRLSEARTRNALEAGAPLIIAEWKRARGGPRWLTPASLMAASSMSGAG